MNKENYTLLLGKIIVNLHALEFSLRAALFNAYNEKSNINLDNISEGYIVDKSALTDFSCLKDLILKYNNITPDLKDKIDENIVTLRDALAHGRVFSTNIQNPLPLKLLKFNNSKKSEKVTVEFAQTMTEEWLKEQVKKTCEEFKKVEPFLPKSPT